MLLSIENLTFSFPGFDIDIPHLELPSGKNFIMGPNGSGKTTLLKVINGLYRQHTGNIELNGKIINDVPTWKRQISYVPQNLLLFPHLSVRKNLLFSVDHGNGKMEIFDEIVEDLQLKDLLDRKTDEISGGQSQRVALARSIISSPSLVLLDEPLSMQDISTRLYMLSKLDDLMGKYSFSVIYVTHNQSDLDFGFDSVTFIHAGRVVESVKSLEDIKNVVSKTMFNDGNVVQIGQEYYTLDERSIYFSDKPGLTYRFWKGLSYNVYALNIDGKEYFLKLSLMPSGKYMNFDLESATRLSI
ncbi:MAG: ABC transporter ATP-binding protein [Thermoplasmatales archaeon]|nr:ABC transporter ATP-binding protein [Thermoplasmatales archaeon]